MGNFSQKVSTGFQSFLAKNSNEVEAAKQAESSLRGIPVPIGWEGEVLITDLVFAESKVTQQGDGSSKGGNPTVSMTVQVLAEGQYKNTKLYRSWTFNDSGAYSGTEKFGWFLNDLVMMGLPDTIKKNFKDPEEIVQFFLEKPYTVKCSCIQTKNLSYNDGKELRFRKEGVALSTTTDVAPPGSTTSAPGPKEHQVGDDVTFVDSPHKIIAKNTNGTFNIQSKSTGRIRENINSSDFGT